MKIISYLKKLGIAAITMPLFISCSFFDVEDMTDPNAPAVETVLNNASLSQLQQLGIGVQSAARSGVSNVYRVAGVIGREVYVLSSTELTWTTELLGTSNGGLGSSTIFSTGYYNDLSQIRRRAEIFKVSAQNTAGGTLSDTQKAGIIGFCNTVEGYAMLNMLNMLYQNGIRLTYTDLNSPGDMLKPGPFVPYDEALSAIADLLDEGASALGNAGDSFVFPMTSGYDGFNTPSSYRRFNRAVMARVKMYQKDWSGMLAALDESFLDLNGAISTGPVFTFSTNAGDMANPLFQQRNTTGAPVVVQASFISDAEAGDTRIGQKITKRDAAKSQSGIIGEYDAYQYKTNTDPISILRNEELILMYAEARIQTGDLPEAEMALDKIRTAAGLKTLAVAKPAVPGNKDALIDELLNQRRYSLWFEGHRWFDMRRYDRLDQLPNDQPNHRVFEQMVIPFAEQQWDAKNPQ